MWRGTCTSCCPLAATHSVAVLVRIHRQCSQPERVRYPIGCPRDIAIRRARSPLGLCGIALCSNDLTRLDSSARLGKATDYAALASHIVDNAMLNGETIRLDGAIRMAPR